jgi:phosphoglycerate kinase
MTYLKISDVDIADKRVLIREDLNVPVKDGVITSDVRIKAALETIKYAVEKQAKVIVMSHLGRPTAGVFEEQFSLAPVAKKLSELLGQEVLLVKDWLDGVEVKAGQVVLCENVRFNVGEKKNDEALAQKMAALCDVFVMDAFATAHRKESSTYGVIKYAPVACAGFLLNKELAALGKAMDHPQRPLVAIVGGAKVSTKLTLLKSIIKVADYLIVGGGIANTFLAAAGYKVGRSLYETDLLGEAQELVTFAKSQGKEIPLPLDVVVAKEFAEDAKATVKEIDAVEDDDMILDVGPKTSEKFTAMLKEARTILWNGPVGVFEFEQFAAGTELLANAIATSDAYSVAGGGDTIAAIEKYNIAAKISYISTAGGAFLAYLEGEALPAVAALNEAAKRTAK